MFADLIDKVIDDFKASPGDSVLIDEATLLASAIEESGLTISIEHLRSSIRNFLNDSMDGNDYAIYDGAIYACSVAANHCFGDPDENDDDDYYSVEYQINWLENEDGSYVATICPT